MNIDNGWTWAGVGVVATIGLLAGFARPFMPGAPAIMSWAVGLAYAGLLIVIGAWWASCTDCVSPQSYDSSRGLDFMVTLFWGGLSVAGIFVVTWLGAALSAFLSKALTSKGSA